MIRPPLTRERLQALLDGAVAGPWGVDDDVPTLIYSDSLAGQEVAWCRDGATRDLIVTLHELAVELVNSRTGTITLED